MPTLNSRIQDLARTFVAQIVDAIRGASLGEFLSSEGRKGGDGRATRANRSKAVASEGAARKATASDGVASAAKAMRASGRLPRRSEEEVAAVLGQVVELLRKNKDGMRAEEIRAKLGLQAKEMPRILKSGLSAPKVLTSKGQKRATTYFAK
jgi:hypothetical protein